MAILARQRRIGVGEGGFAHQHVRAVGERERGITQPGIHDERETLAPPRLAHLLEPDHLVSHGEASLPLQPPHVGAGDAEGGEPVREHPPPVRLHQPVADGRHAVRQRLGLHAERGCLEHRAAAVDRPFPQVHHVMEQGRMPEPREHLPVLRRVAGVDHVRHPVQGHPLQHARQAKAVIPVEMGDADPGDLAHRDPGEDHLPLGALTRVEQQPLAVPAQQVAIVVAAAGGCLARRAQHHQLTIRHGIRPYAGHGRGSGFRLGNGGPGKWPLRRAGCRG